jgi:putative hydrolase of the HAD superfamily
MRNKKLIHKYIRPLTPVPTSLEPALRPIDNIQAILFDVYGTLFISDAGDISLAEKRNPRYGPLKKLVERYGVKKNPERIFDHLYHEIETRHLEKIEQGIDFPEVNIIDVWMAVTGMTDTATATKFAAEFEMIVNPVFPMPNLDKTMEACKKKKLAMGIISNAQFYTPYLFQWFLGGRPENIGFHPDLIFYSYEYGVAKPSRTLFEKAREKLDEMGIIPDAALYVGNDMRNDILPAHQTGFKTALFAGDARSLRLRDTDEACRAISPDVIVTDLSHLMDVI